MHDKKYFIQIEKEYLIDKGVLHKCKYNYSKDTFIT